MGNPWKHARALRMNIEQRDRSEHGGGRKHAWKAQSFKTQKLSLAPERTSTGRPKRWLSFLGRAVDRIWIRFHVLLKYRIVKRELSNFELAACSPRANPFGQIRCSGKPLTDSDQSDEMIRLSLFCRWMMTNLLRMRVLRWSDYLNSADGWWPTFWWSKLSKLCEGERVNVGEQMGSRKGQRGKITNELKELIINN